MKIKPEGAENISSSENIQVEKWLDKQTSRCFLFYKIQIGSLTICFSRKLCDFWWWTLFFTFFGDTSGDWFCKSYLSLVFVTYSSLFCHLKTPLFSPLLVIFSTTLGIYHYFWKLFITFHSSLLFVLVLARKFGRNCEKKLFIFPNFSRSLFLSLCLCPKIWWKLWNNFSYFQTFFS